MRSWMARGSGNSPFAATLLLETRDQRDAAKDENGLDPFDCRFCRANGLDKGRLCWIDDRPRAIQFAPGLPAITLTKEALRHVLPLDDAYLWVADRLRSDGKQVCPVPLTIHPGVAWALEAECDLDAWHIQPLPGPTDDWPADVLALLRHIRGTKGILQMKRMKDQSKKGGAGE